MSSGQRVWMFALIKRQAWMFFSILLFHFHLLTFTAHFHMIKSLNHFLEVFDGIKCCCEIRSVHKWFIFQQWKKNGQNCSYGFGAWWVTERVFIGPESDHCLLLSLADWLTDWLSFSKLDWCDSGLGRCQLKTCWGCYFCWCWGWGSCWPQFVADLEAEVWSWPYDVIKLNYCSDFEQKVWSRFWSWSSCEIFKLMFGWPYKVEPWLRFWS